MIFDIKNITKILHCCSCLQNFLKISKLYNLKHITHLKQQQHLCNLFQVSFLESVQQPTKQNFCMGEKRSKMILFHIIQKYYLPLKL